MFADFECSETCTLNVLSFSAELQRNFEADGQMNLTLVEKDSR